MPTEIRYKDGVIATVEAGNVTTLKCKGKRMKSNVVVMAADSSYYDGAVDIAGGNTVTFVANGSTWAVSGVLPGQAAYPPIGPTKEGLYFNGWYTEENGGGDKIAFPYVPETNITLYANFADTTVIGVTGLTNEDGTLTFTDDIAGMDGHYKVQNGAYVRATSKLNGIFPFCDIEEFTDDNGNVFVKFPKFWMKWETDDEDHITGYKFSNYQADEDFFIPDAFLDPQNTATDTYLDYFALGKYEMSGSTGKGYSVSGSPLLTGITRGEGRAAARAYGSSYNLYNGYQMLDFAQLTLYNLMCMMFFGTANIQKVYGGRTGLGSVAEWDASSITGTTDGVDGLNGWNVNTDCVKMLGVENPYGNASKWVDGIYFSGATIYAHRFPQQYADSTENAISLGFYRPYASGYITALKKGTTDKTRSFVYASEVGGSRNQYYGDSAYCHNGGIYGDALFSGGSYGGNEGAGLWYFAGNSLASDAYEFRGARLAFRPVDIRAGATFTDGTFLTWEELKLKENGTKYGYTASNISDTKIGHYAFADCTGLTSITIPDSVTGFGNNTFRNCTGLTSLTIGSGVTDIRGDYIFLGCTGLTSISVDPNNTTYHSDGNCLIETASKMLILGCKNSVIPADGSVTSIGSSAFSGCGLTSITIPDSVTRIHDYAFQSCTGLTSLTIGSGVTNVSGFAFPGCTGLTSISVDPNNTTYHSDGNCLIETASKTLVAGCKSSVIPADGSVTSIGSSAFSGCGLTSITIPDIVTNVSSFAFSGCTGLMSLTIGEGLTSIDFSTFSGCTALTNIDLPDSITNIDNYAFRGCISLASINYAGSMEDWVNITLGTGWKDGVPATYVQCSDGTISLS